MSDSAKLHYIYGILYLIVALILFGAIVTIVVLSIVKIIEPYFAAIALFFLMIVIVSISASIDEFKKVGQLSQKKISF